MPSSDIEDEKPKHSITDENEYNATSDFVQLLETGRILWPTYFQLAAMSFAWNASLAAGATYTYSQKFVSSAGASGSDFLTIAIIAISLIGIVYNAGALSAYVLMNNVQKEIILSLRKLPPAQSNTVTAQLLFRFVRTDRKQILKHLTHLFFLLLCGCWMVVLIASV